MSVSLIFLLLTLFKNVIGDSEIKNMSSVEMSKLKFRQNMASQKQLAIKLYKIAQQYHSYRVRQFYHKRRFWHTTNEGHLLFKNTIPKTFTKRNKMLIIYVWKKWYEWFRSRHLKGHKNENPLGSCSVKNCKITSDPKKMFKADAVLVNVQTGVLPTSVGERRPSQRWVFHSDESPKNMFSMANQTFNLTSWAKVFNWTMTYRTDSDVPVPYGRTIPLSPYFSPIKMSKPITDLIPNWSRKRRDVLLTTLMSSCNVHRRMSYINKLQKYIPVVVHGNCSEYNKDSCPGYHSRDCPVLKDYIFYLAFENSGCRQYITEKTFHHSFSKGAIPIIMGPPKDDCNKLLPPHSFLHVDDFADPKALSAHLRILIDNEDKLFFHHYWRRFFKITNEHGYSGTASQSICRLCEALNYNAGITKMYSENDLKLFTCFNILCRY